MQACQATENLGPVNKAVGSDTHLLEMEADLLDLHILSCRRNHGACALCGRGPWNLAAGVWGQRGKVRVPGCNTGGILAKEMEGKKAKTKTRGQL